MSDDIKQTQKVNVTHHMAIQRGNNIEAAALYLIYGVGISSLSHAGREPGFRTENRIGSYIES